MVDKKNKKESQRSGLDQHLAERRSVVTKLEKRIAKFDEKVEVLRQEMQQVRNKQDELIDLIKQVYGDKKTRR